MPSTRNNTFCRECFNQGKAKLARNCMKHTTSSISFIEIQMELDRRAQALLDEQDKLKQKWYEHNRFYLELSNARWTL